MQSSLKVEVIAIGDEVLAGFTVNGNAAQVSALLTELGLRTTSHRVLPDERERLKAGLAEGVKANDLVICTGGLGPTLDDVTRKVVAELVGCPLAYNAEVAAELKKRFGEGVPALEDQATIPTAAIPFHNVVGSAPGLLFDLPQCILILLPGVPLEMAAMLQLYVRPYLQRKFEGVLPRSRADLRFFQLREVDVDQQLRVLAAQAKEVQFGIYPGEGVITVRLESAKGRESLKPALNALRQNFGKNLFDSPSGTLEEAVLRRCLDQKRKLACAESCTGGEIGSRLTSIPGASKCFEGSLVTYSNAMKQTLLGVSERTLAKYGAVSEETAGEMVSGLLERTAADCGIAVTGIAGPEGGSEEKPVGLVFIACALKGKAAHIQRFLFRGTRSAIIGLSAANALAELLKIF